MQRLTRPTLLILAFLLDRFRSGDATTWGFEIAAETGLKGGTVYPVLNRLLGEGWLESFWDDETPKGPRRRMYRLTGSGAAEVALLLGARSTQLKENPSWAPTW